jgi:hypothetical protein
MLHAIIDLCCVRIAVVKVERLALVEPESTKTIRKLQPHFGLVPIMLVAFDAHNLSDIQAFSEFPTSAYLADLVEWHRLEPVEWKQLPPLRVPELPF